MEPAYPTDALWDDIVQKTKSLTNGVNYITYILVGSSMGYFFQVLFEGPAHAAEAAPLLLLLAVWPFVHSALDFPWRQQAVNAVREELLALRREASDAPDYYARLKNASTRRRAFLLKGFPLGKSALLGWGPVLALIALIHFGA